ncbi:MAG: hypothetical protein EPO40_02700 [Myxococcaceae bacterium]|nr:MAG: hypothetical protein EPO40_02700 [Myxococcaceae bacterium]
MTTTGRTLDGVSGGAITGPALLLAAKLRVAAWDRTLRDPRPAQLATLLAHCKRGAGTELGRAAGLGRVRTEEDYRARVQVRTYADFEPMLERMRRGERNVLHPEFIEHYGCSSGTSSTAALHKYLPISREQIGWQQKAGFDVVARYLALTGDADFTRGFSLQLMPPAVIRREGPVGITSNPGLMLLHMPRASRRMVLPRPPLRDLENYDLAQYPETTRLLDGSLVLFSQSCPIAAQPEALVDAYAEAFARVWSHLDDVVARG